MAGQTSTAARRYAEAAFELAARDEALDAYGEALDLAAETLGHGTALQVLRNPAQPLKQRIEIVDGLLANRVPDQVLKLVGLLVERGKIDRIGDVAREFRRLLNKQNGIVEALATSAAPLTEAETAALRRKVAQMTSSAVDLRVEVDDSLMGGLTVRVGDTLYDASVRGRLERLRERLVAGAR